MTNVEARMTKEARSLNDEWPSDRHRLLIRHSSLGHSFDIRSSSFVIESVTSSTNAPGTRPSALLLRLLGH